MVARKKARKQRKGTEKRRAASRWRGGSPGGTRLEYVRRMGRWPLRACLIDPRWRTSLRAAIAVVREGPGGRLALGTFLVDLGCLGVKSAVVRGDLRLPEYQCLINEMARRTSGLEPCEPALAARIIEEGRRYAATLGFGPDPDFLWARHFLGDIDPAGCTEDIPLGRDGKPFYVPGPDDDAARITAHLAARLGPQGFEVGEPSAAERDGLLLHRCAELKRAFVAFALSPALGPERARHSQRIGRELDTSDIDDLDEYILGHRLPDGRSLPEFFADETLGLTDRDRAIVRRWANSVLGVFRVVGNGDDHLVLHNLVDELTYRTRSNAGRSALAAYDPGSFLVSRLVPLDDGWLLSGRQHLLKSANEDFALELAASMAWANPRSYFRNPAHREAGFRVQHEEGEDFEEHFGERDVVLRGSELPAAVRAFNTARHHKRARSTAPAPAVTPDFPPDLLRADDVGMIHDDTWGLGFFPDYGRFRAAFRDPDLLARREYREVVRGYLESESVDPSPFLRVGERWPEGATRVFSTLLDRPDFSWARDGEALLRAYKPRSYDPPPIPRHLPFSDRMVRAFQRARARQAR